MNIPALRQFWTLCNSGCGTVPTSPIGWSDRMILLDGTIGPGPGNPSITRFDIMDKKCCPQRYVVVPWQVRLMSIVLELAGRGSAISKARPSRFFFSFLKDALIGEYSVKVPSSKLLWCRHNRISKILKRNFYQGSQLINKVQSCF